MRMMKDPESCLDMVDLGGHQSAKERTESRKGSPRANCDRLSGLPEGKRALHPAIWISLSLFKALTLPPLRLSALCTRWPVPPRCIIPWWHPTLFIYPSMHNPTYLSSSHSLITQLSAGNQETDIKMALMINGGFVSPNNIHLWFIAQRLWIEIPRSTLLWIWKGHGFKQGCSWDSL